MQKKVWFAMVGSSRRTRCRCRTPPTVTGASVLHQGDAQSTDDLAMGRTLGRIVIGFFAAAIAVVTVHQATVWGLTQAGWIKGTPWSLIAMKPDTVPAFVRAMFGGNGPPALLNTVFWGGLWGMLFGLINGAIPGRMMWLKGLIFGLGIAVVSNWLLLPLIKGKIFGQDNQVLFAGYDPQRMLATLLIVGGFGLATGLIYGLMAGRKS